MNCFFDVETVVEFSLVIQISVFRDNRPQNLEKAGYLDSPILIMVARTRFFSHFHLILLILAECNLKIL